MFFRRSSRKRQDAAAEPAVSLPEPLAIDAISPFLRTHLGLPHLNWAESLDHIGRATQTESDADDLAYAMIAGWMGALAQALHAKQSTPLAHWRDTNVEGLAPAADRARMQRSTTKALAIIGNALTPIRGEPEENPIGHITIIVAPTLDVYYDLIDAYAQNDGDFATSGGMYLQASPRNPPTLIVNVGGYALEHTLAHELTHHALRPPSEDAGRLPLWAEEGLTQMMEERVTNHSNFEYKHSVMQRHRALWPSIGLAGFLNGETFFSPVEDQQELSYNLAQAVTRSLLDSRPADFFAFARACLGGQEPAAAALDHLGQCEEDIMMRYLGLEPHT
ncbi:MAG: hypothetical protein ACIAQU_09370 [Phycisphaerales bacterium JB064]